MTSRDSATGCMLWTGAKSPFGYGRFRTTKRDLLGVRKVSMAHRFAWERINGSVPAGLILRHKCDQPSCVNVAHLSIGTHADNSADRDSQGRQARGETIDNSKLSSSEVLTIRGAWNSGVVNKGQLAKAFSVARSTIHSIVTRETWVHI